MRKEFRQVCVSTTDNGVIEISQQWHSPDLDDPVIELVPEQIDAIVTWLQEAKSELLKASDQ